MHSSNAKIIAPIETRLTYEIEVEWLRPMLQNAYTDISRYSMSRAERQVSKLLQHQLKSHPELFEGNRRVEDFEEYFTEKERVKFTENFKNLTEANHSNSRHGCEPRIGGDSYFANATRAVISNSEIYALTGASTKRSTNYLLRQLRRFNFITAKGVEPKVSEFETPSSYTIYDINSLEQITINLGQFDKVFLEHRCSNFEEAVSKEILSDGKKVSDDESRGNFKMSLSIFGALKEKMGLTRLLDSYAKNGEYDLEVTASKSHKDLEDTMIRENYLDYMRSATRITGDIHDLAEHLGMKLYDPEEKNMEAAQA